MPKLILAYRRIVSTKTVNKPIYQTKHIQPSKDFNCYLKISRNKPRIHLTVCCLFLVFGFKITFSNRPRTVLTSTYFYLLIYIKSDGKHPLGLFLNNFSSFICVFLEFTRTFQYWCTFTQNNLEIIHPDRPQPLPWYFVNLHLHLFIFT